MASQVPAGAEGTVAGVMIYCSICLIASMMMIWLTWTHQERTSYVAMLAYFATLSILASLAQQTHDILRYRALVAEQFENRKLHPGNPEIAIANGSVGLSLVLYYIQYYCYAVEALSVMFWAGYLAQSSNTRSKWKNLFNIINRGGKIFAVLFPLTTILLLRIPQVQENFVVFILLADLPLMLSLLFGCMLMLLIFTRYVNSKRKFLHWGEDSNTGTYGTGTGTGVESTLDSAHRPATRDPKASTTTTVTSNAPRRKRQGIWDRWLMLRFTIGFVALSIFEVTNTLFQIMAVTNANSDLAAAEPDLSPERASADWIFFMPGVTPGLFIFIIFGTTTPLRRYMRETLVPKGWRQRKDDDVERGLGSKLSTLRRADTAPTPPPKDNVHVTSEIELSVSSRMRGASRSGRSGNGGDAVESVRSDSDEWPMLPIMKHDRR
ncbi:hypothetical protein MGG_05800 [Pyricularia oryzae 70-15]|uniref:Glycoside hydrolase n=1 Tax=Pyricularia oryzae (strain 70-15 / ATCC MYA-4617 / FGSC 8958) TaxID=242507 RepID=G4N0H3_PYRO7|nr:uncharacterized protein MGG_05800 [Pyricularia oryzae 70-15]EHA52307.1 hypothetical protein MGG_05800 [Pyricularia oryzae 70-15]KAI7909648.1 hypothetical protein M9X92_011512 [Pyricularia oryzae]KAI7910343.1 hypothetical protein M0657_011410 [Pyricularia oryzae]